MTDTDDRLTATGQVKWFDVRKGFGFIAVDGYPDILLHANVLRNYGQSDVSDGTQITAEIRESGRGWQVLSIVSLEMNEPIEAKISSEFFDYSNEFLDELNILPARVKWFDEVKGFGFLNTFGNVDDVFVHIDVLRASGLGIVEAGSAIAVKVAQGERGLLAVKAYSWNAVVDT